MDYLSKIKETVAEAELVVVGLGEEWNMSLETQSGEIYQRVLADLKAYPEYQWLLPYIYEKLTDDVLQNAYKTLFELLQNKNYFVVATTMNPSFLPYAKADRVVMPCGNALKMRTEELADVKAYPEFLASLDKYLSGEITLGEIEFVKDEQRTVVPFNNVFAPNYREDGYLTEWNTYMRWLQGTMNRKTCLLELGAGLDFPSVFRFPFEKMVYFNQKATCFRVHSFLYQLTEEMVERSESIPMHAVALFSQK